jgi:hypothetical protein
VPIPNDEPPSINDIPRALGLPPYPSLEDEVKRALPIPPRRTEPQIYVPEPGSPLRIPIVDSNADGRPGNPLTKQETKELANSIEKECSKVLKQLKPEILVTFEHRFPPFDGKPGQLRDGSYADGLVRIKIGPVTIDVVADTYSSKVNSLPNAGEQNRFFQLQRNLTEHNAIIVRVPKAWPHGQTINKERLSKATREICEQIKNMIERGDLVKGQEPIFIEKLLDRLLKPRSQRGPTPQERGAPEPTNPPEP